MFSAAARSITAGRACSQHRSDHGTLDALERCRIVESDKSTGFDRPSPSQASSEELSFIHSGMLCPRRFSPPCSTRTHQHACMITHPVLVPCQHDIASVYFAPVPNASGKITPTVYAVKNIELNRPRSQSYTAACARCRLCLFLFILLVSSRLIVLVQSRKKIQHSHSINRSGHLSSPSSSAHPSVSSQTAACPASCSRRCARGTATAKTRRASSPAASAGPCSPGSPRRRPSTGTAWKRARQSSAGRTAASARASLGTRPRWNGAASRCSGREPRRLADSRLEGPRRRLRWTRLCCRELRPSWSGPWPAWPMQQMRCSFGICRDGITLC